MYLSLFAAESLILGTMKNCKTAEDESRKKKLKSKTGDII